MVKVFKRFFDIIFVFFIVVLIGYFVLRGMGFLEIYEVQTGSMENGIHVGDYVLIFRKEKYVIGDVVTYSKDDYFITHRIIKSIDGDKVITKGDANNLEDEEINVSSIKGKVIYNGGLLNIIIDYKYGIVSVLLGVYLLSYYFDKQAKDKQKLIEMNRKDEFNSKDIEFKKYKKRKIYKRT